MMATTGKGCGGKTNPHSSPSSNPRMKRLGSKTVPRRSPRARLSLAELHGSLANASGLLPKDAKVFLEALREVAAENLRDRGCFKIPNIVMLRKRTTPERSATKKRMFGKDVVLAAKPASCKICARALLPLYDGLR